jgi:hypothetical protein
MLFPKIIARLKPLIPGANGRPGPRPVASNPQDPPAAGATMPDPLKGLVEKKYRPSTDEVVSPELTGVVLPPEVVDLGTPERVFSPRHPTPMVKKQGPIYILYEDTLVALLGGVWQVIRWRDVVAFRGGRPGGTGDSHLMLRGGKEAVLSGQVYCSDALAHTVERRVHGPLLAHALHAIDSGRLVPFGPISLGPDGPSFRGRVVGWHAVRKISLTAPVNSPDPHLIVEGHDETWCVTPLWPIPSRSVLLSLLQDLRPAHIPLTIDPAVRVALPGA